MEKSPLDILKQYWGYESFRPLQEDIIQSVLQGRDTLALLPTGGGKSLCYQIPALCRDGICIVVSPLIALMKDQVQQLQDRNISAVAVYAGMHYRDIDRVFDNCAHGHYKLLYLSPERLTTELARERIKRMRVNLLAVDEAHCVSQWGYDFRPPYLQIPEIREWLPGVPVLALTATATQPVVTDIQEKLAFKNQQVFFQSFARDNLSFAVVQEDAKDQKLLEILRKIPGCAVVYVRNRRRTKEIAQLLRQNRIAADYYHAGLNMEERSAKQDAWIRNKTRVIVATNAFGMGIDKPDVRLVVHMDLPDSLEAYYQEAGRGGRDGKRAFAVLLYNQADKQMLERSLELSFPDMPLIRQVYQALGHYYQLAVGGGEGQSFDFDIVHFCESFRLDAAKVLPCLQLLEQAGWLSLSESVFTPSALMIKVSKESLYDFQLKHPRFDPLLKTILRTYQGAFQQHIYFRESQLAKFLKIATDELTRLVMHLQKEGILDYQPQKDQPQLTFLLERVDGVNLTIDRELFRFREERYRERIRAAIDYAETNRCRSQQLLNYFAETGSQPCGHCDVCRGRHQSELDNDSYERYRRKIADLLQREKLTMAQIVDSFVEKRRPDVLRTLEYLLDEGYIDKEGEWIVWKER